MNYLALRGRCRSCGQGISWRYPAVEAVNALMYVGLVLRMGIGPRTAVLALFATALLVVTFIDLDHRIIPNVISFPGMAAGVVFSLAPGHPNPVYSLIGLLAGGGFLYAVAAGYFFLTKREGMGMGTLNCWG